MSNADAVHSHEPPTEATVVSAAGRQPALPELIESNSVVPLPTIRAQRPRGANGRFVRLETDQSSDDEPADLPEGRFLDREVSWLQFNERVLQLAADPDLPLLERVRFLAIFTSNLDEFFMVRVAGLKRRIAAGLAVRAVSGLMPREVLEQIWRTTRELSERQANLFRDEIGKGGKATCFFSFCVFFWVLSSKMT